MHTLQTYSSSSSDGEQQSNNHHPSYAAHAPETAAPSSRATPLPPPDQLEATDVHANSSSRELSRSMPVSLPRVTSVQHTVDRYLVHVFLPIDRLDVSSFVRGLLAQARLAMVGKPVKAALTVLTDFHISISRPAVIQSAQIPSLVKQLRKAISQRPRGHVEMRNKPVAFHSKNQRRLFLAAPVVTEGSEQHDFTLKLIGLVSDVFERNGLPRFFDDPRPHMSFAWTHTVDVSPVFTEPDVEESKGDSITVHAEKVLCVIGKSNYSFPLK